MTLLTESWCKAPRCSSLHPGLTATFFGQVMVMTYLFVAGLYNPSQGHLVQHIYTVPMLVNTELRVLVEKAQFLLNILFHNW